MSEMAPKRRGFVRGLLIDLSVMTLIGVVLALIGPFGSFNDPLAIRLIVWVGFAWIGYALYSPIDAVAQRLAPALDLPVWTLRLAGVLLSSIPMAVVVWVLPRGFGSLQWPGASAALEHYLYVAFIGGLITVVNSLFQKGAAEPRIVTPPPVPDELRPEHSQPDPANRLMDRLSPEMGVDLIALEMEDHYVRAHTALGSELLLMRMRDAVAELHPVQGEQVHRSWWVARGAVADVKRDGRNIQLVLDNGLEAPVSRANVQRLKDEGWL
ncbi:LytTR family DNA-binding domain-containing protein [Aurantiacibacter gangjinensis]|uniref:Uncharacterized protein n=1 Tax=Aurantiacibacter gangjinensis TaxID=502682 RepID=A0A0G9MPE2_9SPHN|nr:LytTR family DNA-binding domain-containing protein [Aurantiacibacter gangjinensis]APE29276.1 hypothetical protein BMF35_b0021 [Aurantiacibacter gangjinensis]KLE31123.1 hypothetical protein AAW01_12905 [Aurantiacibacter gangjinensis]